MLLDCSDWAGTGFNRKISIFCIEAIPPKKSQLRTKKYFFRVQKNFEKCWPKIEKCWPKIENPNFENFHFFHFFFFFKFFYKSKGLSTFFCGTISKFKIFSKVKALCSFFCGTKPSPQKSVTDRLTDKQRQKHRARISFGCPMNLLNFEMMDKYTTNIQ